MSAQNFYFTRKMILSFLILPSIVHVTLSDNKLYDLFWCGNVQEEVIEVWSGQNISIRFDLGDPLSLHVQTLVWRKVKSWVIRNDRILEYNGYGDFEVGRYRLTAVSNIDFDLFISDTEQNDSGHHILTVDHGGKPLCLVLELNLIVKTREPICSTQLNDESRQLQMSCEWLQINEGDQAHFEVDNEIVYEHQIPELNFNGSFNNMTHQFSVYVGLDEILDEITVSKKCIVSYQNRQAREVCEFPVVTPHPNTYTHGENVDFECCVDKPGRPILLVYDGDGNGLPVESTQNGKERSARDADYVLFFICGSDGAMSEITILNMTNLDFRKYANYESSTFSLIVSDPKLLYNNSREHEHCEVITVGTSPESATQVRVSTQETGTPSKPDGITGKHQATMETYLISVLVVSTIAHGVSIIAFAFSYRRT